MLALPLLVGRAVQHGLQRRRRAAAAARPPVTARWSCLSVYGVPFHHRPALVPAHAWLTLCTLWRAVQANMAKFLEEQVCDQLPESIAPTCKMVRAGRQWGAAGWGVRAREQCGCWARGSKDEKGEVGGIVQVVDSCHGRL